MIGTPVLFFVSSMLTASVTTMIILPATRTTASLTDTSSLTTTIGRLRSRGEVSLIEAFERGRRNYRAIGRALVFGAWLFRVGSLLFMIMLYYLGVTTDFSAPGAGAFNAAAFGPMLLFMCSHVFAECLTAIVLVRAYRRFPVMSSDAVTT